MAEEKWIQRVIKRPGALRAAAKRAGAITKKGTIEKSWIAKQTKKGGRIGKQAVLAQTLAKLRKRAGAAKAALRG